MAEGIFVQCDGGSLRWWEAGSGEAVVAIAGGRPTRAHALLAERRRVLVFAPPSDAAAAQQAAGEIGAALAGLGIARFDLIGEGAGAASALWLAASRAADIGSLVLAAPDGAPDAPCRTIERPALVLCGTRQGAGAAEPYRALLPDSHFMFVYDAGREIGAERPEALAFIAAEFFERHELFLVSRESGVVFP